MDRRVALINELRVLVPVSRGYLAKLCTATISDSLKESYDELTAAIPRQEQLDSDETAKFLAKSRHYKCEAGLA